MTPAPSPPVPDDACRLCGSARAAPLFVKNGQPIVRCLDCGLIVVRPLPPPAVIEAHHEESYRDGAYATFAAAETVRTAIARQRLGLVRPLAPPGP